MIFCMLFRWLQKKKSQALQITLPNCYKIAQKYINDTTVAS